MKATWIRDRHDLPLSFIGRAGNDGPKANSKAANDVLRIAHSTIMASGASAKGVVITVFLALLLDLLGGSSCTFRSLLMTAFTLPLPLFPRLIAWFLEKEAESKDRLLSYLLSFTRAWRSTLLSYASSSGSRTSHVENKNWDVVLLGGGMGSLFSLCQCIISPYLGRCGYLFYLLDHR